MGNILRAVVRDGRIEVRDPVELPEGTKLEIAVLGEDDRQFWQGVNQVSLDAIWNNPEDDIYAQLLKG